MGIDSYLLAALVFAVACLLTRLLAGSGPGRFMLDHPSHRSLHARPTPRGGGIAIGVAVFVGIVGLALLVPVSPTVVWLGVAALGIAVVSFIDDLSHVHPAARMVVHFIVAAGLLAAGFGLHSIALPTIAWAPPSSIAILLTALFVVWLVNLYNFMDGMDGFAAGMAIFGFGTFAWLGATQGQETFATMSLVVAAAAGGFLVFNFPPARIFMGDLGSSVLGVLAAGMSLWAARDGIFPLWVGVLVFSPFIFDATFTLLRRLARRERVWEAHKTHCYQRLVESGWGHRKTVLWEYALMAACSVSAVAAVNLSGVGQWLLLTMWAGIYVILLVLVHRFETRRERNERIEAL